MSCSKHVNTFMKLCLDTVVAIIPCLYERVSFPFWKATTCRLKVVSLPSPTGNCYPLPSWNYGFTKTGMLGKWSFPFGACRPLERLLLVLGRVTLIPSWKLTYPTLGKGNCIFKIDFFREKYMLVPRRVTQSLTHWAIIRNIFHNLEVRRETFLDAGIF